MPHHTTPYHTMHVHTNAHTDICMHTYITHGCIHLCTHACMNMQTYAHMCTHLSHYTTPHHTMHNFSNFESLSIFNEIILHTVWIIYLMHCLLIFSDDALFSSPLSNSLTRVSTGLDILIFLILSWYCKSGIDFLIFSWYFQNICPSLDILMLAKARTHLIVVMFVTLY